MEQTLIATVTRIWSDLKAVFHNQMLPFNTVSRSVLDGLIHNVKTLLRR